MKKNFKDKYSKWYKYYSNDFKLERKNQFISIFYQAREAIINPNINSMLEFGIGRGCTSAIIKHFKIKHVGVDFNEELFFPDHVSTILNYRDKKKYDIVCAFQVLEHNPLESIKSNLKKMMNLSNKYVYVSVPYSGRYISLNIKLNLFPGKFGYFNKQLNLNWGRLFKKVRPVEEYKKRIDKYNPHWWEVGDKNFTKGDFKKIISSLDMKIEKSFHNEFFPYHLFYLLKKNTT